tara:strand:- start:5378 stop:6586 length:1209 start_codon:yes stop_codon:yes gene_type:complete
MNCKITGKLLSPIHSFGKMPMANNFIENEKDFEKEYFFNLEFSFNEEISLFQINEYPDAKNFFNEKYPFFTGLSKYMVNHFEKYYNSLNKKNLFNKNSFVLEIGSNDGSFLKNFQKNNIKCLGVDPSKSASDKAKNVGLQIIDDFFNVQTAKKIFNKFGKVDLIVSANAICHIPDLNDLISAIDIVLSEKGSFVFEENYLLEMIKKTSFDQIYNEHIYIFSLIAIDKVFSLYGFKLYDCEPQSTHGGSMRYYICREGAQKVTNRLKIHMQIEIKNKLDKFETYVKFGNDCEILKSKIYKKLKKIKNDNKRIIGYGATAKSTTILNYCEIDNNIIDFIVDTTPEKHWKFSPGKHIQILPYEFFEKDYPEYAYLFAWNHKDEILIKEKKFTSNGGKFISHIDLK